MHGVVTDVEIAATPANDGVRGTSYRIHLTSWMGLLEREVDCRIYQDQDVKEIVSAVLRGAGIDDQRQSRRLVSSYPKRTYCVQYNESSLAFVSRLLEEEGHHLSRRSRRRWRDRRLRGRQHRERPHRRERGGPLPLRRWARRRRGRDLRRRSDDRTATGRWSCVTTTSEAPEIVQTVTAAADTDADLESVRCSGAVHRATRGQRLARDPAWKRCRPSARCLTLESGCARLTAGRWFALVDAHPMSSTVTISSPAAVHELRDGVYLVRGHDRSEDRPLS